MPFYGAKDEFLINETNLKIVERNEEMNSYVVSGEMVMMARIQNIRI